MQQADKHNKVHGLNLKMDFASKITFIRKHFMDPRRIRIIGTSKKRVFTAEAKDDIAKMMNVPKASSIDSFFVVCITFDAHSFLTLFLVGFLPCLHVQRCKKAFDRLSSSWNRRQIYQAYWDLTF